MNTKFPAKPCFGRYAFAEPVGAVVDVGDVVMLEEYVEDSGQSDGLDMSKIGQSRRVVAGCIGSFAVQGIS